MCGSSLTEFAKLLQAAGEHHVVEGKGLLVKAVRQDGDGWGYVYIVELSATVVPDGNACTTASYGR